MDKIYLDYASTTPVDQRVVRAMIPYLSENFENASALYSGALKIRSAIDGSREVLSRFLHCNADEVVFTSGGTESDNMAIMGVLGLFKSGHIITTIIEHPAVLKPIQYLEKRGFDVTYLKPNKSGIVSAKQVRDALRADTVLVSVMYANNEIGTIQPIKEIAKVISNFRSQKPETRDQKKKSNPKSFSDFRLQTSDFKREYPLFHTDACQAAGYLNMDVAKLGVDLLTLNGSKIYAPKGVGVLFIKKGIKIQPLLLGGSQEMDLRSGTENVPSIVALAKAISLISSKESLREERLRNYLIAELLKIEGVTLNGDSQKRLPNNVNVSVDGIEGESIVLYLDRKGIEIATGSACSSKSLEPSRIIMAIADEVTAHSSLRITLGRFTKKAELDIFLKEFRQAVNNLREISAL